jgi:ribonuclease HI
MKHVEAYCDGSCQPNPGPGNCAAILMLKEGKNLLVKEEFVGTIENGSTNQRQELLAAILVLKNIKIKDVPIYIYSDSKYLVDGMTKWLKSWKNNKWKKKGGEEIKNLELWIELYAMTYDKEVTWIWVKGHADNQHNNRCDKLAVNSLKKFILK